MAADNGLARLNRAFKSMPKAARKAIMPAVEQGADELVARMKLLAPVDEVDGGELRDSIRKEHGPQPLSVTVTAGGPTTTRETAIGPFDYALAVEYGTERTPAQQYFFISERMLKKRIKRRIDRAISKAVKAEWSK